MIRKCMLCMSFVLSAAYCQAVTLNTYSIDYSMVLPCSNDVIVPAEFDTAVSDSVVPAHNHYVAQRNVCISINGIIFKTFSHKPDMVIEVDSDRLEDDLFLLRNYYNQPVYSGSDVETVSLLLNYSY